MEIDEYVRTGFRGARQPLSDDGMEVILLLTIIATTTTTTGEITC
jgi:hypothetical protein